MQDNKNYRPRQRPVFTSIDGISRPVPRDHIQNLSSNLPSQTSARDNNISPMPRQPLFNASSSYDRQSFPALNSSIPLAAPGTFQNQQTRRRGKLKKKLTRRQIIKRSVLACIILIIGFGGFFVYRNLNVINKVFHGNLISDAQALFGTTRLNGESTGRVNILLAGYQGSSSDEGPLTDSIMVVSLDTKNNTAFTFSIPRDLWVDVPGIGHEKINAANTNTSFNQPGYFSGGMGQLQQVVEQKLGIPINYYALIDYTAFEDAVNAVGGITVNIQSPDPRGLYDPNVDKAHGGPLKLPNGPVTLNGLSALALALARGDSPYAYGFPLSDINRTQHQRQMLIALEKKALSAGVLSNPLTISRLVSALGNNVSVVNYAKCYVTLEQGNPVVNYRGEVLTDIDAIIPRISARLTNYGASIVRQFEMQNVFSTTSSISIVRARDKLRSMQLLSKSGVGIPKTVFARETADYEGVLEQVGGAPVIIKVARGTHGTGVVLGETRKAALAVMQAFNVEGVNFLVQEFVAESRGEDIRAFVVNGKVIASMMRKSKDDDFRANPDKLYQYVVLSDHGIAIPASVFMLPKMMSESYER